MQMKFLRGILGKPRKDKIRNTLIEEELKVEEIKNDIQSLDKKYWQHCCHMMMVSLRAASFVYMNKNC